MAIPTGTYRLGPADGILSVRTKRTGAAAKAGHNLLLHVTAWEATLEVGADPVELSLELDVDGASLSVREGTGGMQALGDDDKENIERTIDDEVLQRQGITFRSTEVQAVADGGLSVRGDLTLLGTTRPLTFDIAVAKDGRLSATAVVKQSDWGMKPYSTLFGALKVVDEVEVGIDAALPQTADSPPSQAVALSSAAVAERSPRPAGFPVLWAPVTLALGVEIAVALAWIAR